MESNRYKVLWLDDDFVNENGSLNLPLQFIKKSFSMLDIETVPYIDWCEKIIDERGDEFHVIILDVNGKSSMNPSMKPKPNDFIPLLSKARKKSAALYVYSGELSPDRDGGTPMRQMLEELGFIKGVNLCFKTPMPCRIFLDHVIAELKKDYHVFYDYPEILDNVLHYGVNKECVKDLLLWMKDKTLPFPEYDSLRRIIYDEGIDQRLKPFLGCDLPNIQRRYLTDECMSEWEQAIIFGLLKDLLNKEVHNWPSDDIHSKEIISHAFITTMNWYNRFMHKIEKNSNPHDYYTLAKSTEGVAQKSSTNYAASKVQRNKEQYEGIVEIDENGFYKVGPYLLKNKLGERYLGKYVKVIETTFFPYKQRAKKVEEIQETPQTDFADKLNQALKK